MMNAALSRLFPQARVFVRKHRFPAGPALASPAGHGYGRGMNLGHKLFVRKPRKPRP